MKTWGRTRRSQIDYENPKYFVSRRHYFDDLCGWLVSVRRSGRGVIFFRARFHFNRKRGFGVHATQWSNRFRTSWPGDGQLTHGAHRLRACQQHRKRQRAGGIDAVSAR
jgi:hypothetical protein